MEIVTDIQLDPRNYRIHSKENKELIKKSLTECGAGRSVLIDKEGKLIAGNGVFEQAKALKIPTKIVQTDGNTLVVVQRTDLATADKKRQRLAVLDNSASDLSVFNNEKIRKDFTVEEIKELGVQEVEISAESPTITEDEVPDADKVETRVKKGDIWQLGEHRLMCGDSTVQTDVERLMAGEKADMVFTDPPYNVSFNGRSGKFEVIKNDNLTHSEFKDFITAFLSILKIVNPTTYYICCNWAFYGILQLELKPKACIVWAKNVFGMGKGYRHQHEFILFDGFIDGAITNESDLWQIKKDVNYKHPTQKPVELPARAIKNSSKISQIVLDLFGGSGSTLIACEQLKRKCRMMELDEHYCDVIIKRWENLTGKEAKLCK